MTLLRLAVCALWLTLGLGLVPTLVYLALGLALYLPFPEVGRHLLKLAARTADPLGTRVCNLAGQGTLRWVPFLAVAAVADRALAEVDPDGLLELDDGRLDAQGLSQAGSAQVLEAIASVAWVLLLGWELMIFHIVVGLLLCLTLVGAVFGVRHLALAAVSLLPTRFLVLREGERPPRRAPRFVLRASP